MLSRSISSLEEYRYRRGDEPHPQSSVIKMLRDLADNIESGHPSRTYPTGLVVLLNDYGPLVAWTGVNRAHMDEASAVLADASYAVKESENLETSITEGFNQRKTVRTRRNNTRTRQMIDFPWTCEHCDIRRFRTERGAVQHERQCLLNPLRNPKTQTNLNR